LSMEMRFLPALFMGVSGRFILARPCFSCCFIVSSYKSGWLMDGIKVIIAWPFDG
ncbi:MAG: hypothetical protein DQL93_0005, partial (endogenous virus) [Lactobacillus phage ViSo-2018b]